MSKLIRELGKIITDNILRQVSLRALAEEAGAVFKGDSSPCPLHGGGDPHALQLYDGDQKWRCPVCCPSEEGSSLFHFYMRWRGVDGETAIRELSARAGLPLPPPPTGSDLWEIRARKFAEFAHAQLLDPEAGAPARAYLTAERGLCPETWQAFNLGYNPSTRYEPAADWGLPGDKSLCLPQGIVIPCMKYDYPIFLKILRPLPGDPLCKYLASDAKSRGRQYAAPRGGRSALFGAHRFTQWRVLLLAASVWDAMLAWQVAGDLCDATCVCSSNGKTGNIDLTVPSCYTIVLSLSGSDTTVEQSLRDEIGESWGRVVSLDPPAHDLVEFTRRGGNLRAWIACQIATHLAKYKDTLNSLIPGLSPTLYLRDLKKARRAARGE